VRGAITFSENGSLRFRVNASHDASHDASNARTEPNRSARVQSVSMCDARRQSLLACRGSIVDAVD
jgi:hypothetical protein